MYIGNSWGCDFDDPHNCDIGLGAQEQFYGCADVAITASGELNFYLSQTNTHTWARIHKKTKPGFRLKFDTFCIGHLSVNSG